MSGRDDPPVNATTTARVMKATTATEGRENLPPTAP